MLCRRCRGLMIVEPLYGVQEQAVPPGMLGARCINCGNVEDAVIHANRAEPHSIDRTARYNIVTEMEGTPLPRKFSRTSRQSREVSLANVQGGAHEC